MQITARFYSWTTVIFNIHKWSPEWSPIWYNFCRRCKPIFWTERHNSPFLTVNRELQNINEWFISNKLSLNVKKTKFLTFYEASRRDDLSFVLPKFVTCPNNQAIKRQSSIKLLRILLDENLSWKKHLKLTKNKIAKNIELI